MTAHVAETPTPIVEGKLYALGGTVEHGGLISWVPPAAAGAAALNAYVLTEGTTGLVVDTSLPVLEDGVVAQLRTLGLEHLTILLTRVVEFDSIGNAEAIVANFGVDTIYAQFPPDEWIFLRDDYPERAPAPTFASRVYEKDEDLEIAPGRTVSIVNSKLKLLACAWVFDHATGTLFTSDSFSHVLAQAPDARIVTAANDTSTLDDVVRHLLTKFDWLQGADTEPVRAFVDGIFERFDVTTIAPTIGCVLSGRDVVARHRAMLDEGLRRLGAAQAVAA